MQRLLEFGRPLEVLLFIINFLSLEVVVACGVEALHLALAYPILEVIHLQLRAGLHRCLDVLPPLSEPPTSPRLLFTVEGRAPASAGQAFSQWDAVALAVVRPCREGGTPLLH